MSLRIQTKSLTSSGDWLFSFHLNLLSGVGRYYLTTRFQKWLIIWCMFVHDLKLAGISLSEFPCGRELNRRLIWRWSGVRGISLLGRSATFVRGRELKMASLSTNIFGMRQVRVFLSLESTEAFFSLSVSCAPEHSRSGAISRVEFPSCVCSCKSFVYFVVVEALYTFLELFWRSNECLSIIIVLHFWLTLSTSKTCIEEITGVEIWAAFKVDCSRDQARKDQSIMLFKIFFCVLYIKWSKEVTTIEEREFCCEWWETESWKRNHAWLYVLCIKSSA